MVTNGQIRSEGLGGVVTGDLGPLAWVLEETRKSIDLATKSLKRYARDAEAARGVDLAAVDASQLRIARQHLHQVVGALDMVGQSLAAQMVRAMESAVQKYVLRPETCSEAEAAKLERAGFALVDYLENQLSEKPRAALGLFPQYKQVLEMSGADRIHPADLWANTWRWVDAATPAAAQRISYGPDIRGRLDQRVLKIMKRGDVNAASELSVVALGLADGETARQPVIFWKLSAAFFEALAKALVPMDVYAKRGVAHSFAVRVARARRSERFRAACAGSPVLCRSGSACAAQRRSGRRCGQACLGPGQLRTRQLRRVRLRALRSGSACAGAPANRIGQGELVRIGRRRHGAPKGLRGSVWLGG